MITLLWRSGSGATDDATGLHGWDWLLAPGRYGTLGLDASCLSGVLCQAVIGYIKCTFGEGSHICTLAQQAGERGKALPSYLEDAGTTFDPGC